MLAGLLLGLLGGVFGFLILLKGGLVQRRSDTLGAQERSADYLLLVAWCLMLAG